MMEHRILPIGLFVLTLAGCATGAPRGMSSDPAPVADLTALQTFVHEDLQAALDDALAHGDMVAADCWGTLDTVVTEVAKTASRPAPRGAVSTFQILRDATRQATSGPSPLLTTINRGCAALFVDAQVTLGRLGLLVGGAILK